MQRQDFVGMTKREQGALKRFDVGSLDFLAYDLTGVFPGDPEVSEAAARLFSLWQYGAGVLHKTRDIPIGWCGVPVAMFDAMLQHDLDRYGEAFKAHQQAIRDAELQNGKLIAQHRADERARFWRGVRHLGIPLIFGKAIKPPELKVVTNGHIPVSGIFEEGPGFARIGLHQLLNQELIRVVRKGKKPNQIDVIFPTPELLTKAGRFFIN